MQFQSSTALRVPTVCTQTASPVHVWCSAEDRGTVTCRRTHMPSWRRARRELFLPSTDARASARARTHTASKRPWKLLIRLPVPVLRLAYLYSLFCSPPSVCSLIFPPSSSILCLALLLSVQSTLLLQYDAREDAVLHPPWPGVSALSPHRLHAMGHHLNACGIVHRHHNVDDKTHIRDALLTDEGIEQARLHNESIRDNVSKQAELIVCSPLRRTVQTMLYGYADAVARLGKDRIIIMPEVQEASNGKWNPSLSRPNARLTNSCMHDRRSVRYWPGQGRSIKGPSIPGA